jgi:hypothetical protein
LLVFGLNTKTREYRWTVISDLGDWELEPDGSDVGKVFDFVAEHVRMS